MRARKVFIEVYFRICNNISIYDGMEYSGNSKKGDRKDISAAVFEQIR